MCFRTLMLGVALIFSSAPAFAWDNTINPGPGPSSIADGGPSQAQQSNSHSYSHASASNSVTVNNSPTAYGGSNSGSGSGNGWGNIPPATAYAPSYGTANPCVGKGASVAGQTPLFGLSAGGQMFDYGCAAERIGNMTTVGEQLDFAYQCLDDRQFRNAAYSIGHPCPADRQKYADWVAAQQQTLPVSNVGIVPDWCATASLAEKRRHPICLHH